MRFVLRQNPQNEPLGRLVFGGDVPYSFRGEDAPRYCQIIAVLLVRTFGTFGFAARDFKLARCVSVDRIFLIRNIC